MDMHRTFVLPAGRGQGVARALCDHAFQFAKEQEYQVKPTCSYIRDHYLKQ